MLMILDRVFEEALDHVILGMFTCSYKSKQIYTILTIGSIENPNEEEVSRTESLHRNDPVSCPTTWPEDYRLKTTP